MSPVAIADGVSTVVGMRSSTVDRASTIRTGELVVDLETSVVSVHDKRVRLTDKEYSILELLSLWQGSTVTKEMLLSHLYGGMDEPKLKIIDVFVCHLRKKLAQATGGQHYIQTIWGRGYVLRDDPARMPSAALAVGAQDDDTHHDGLAPEPLKERTASSQLQRCLQAGAKPMTWMAPWQ